MGINPISDIKLTNEMILKNVKLSTSKNLTKI